MQRILDSGESIPGGVALRQNTSVYAYRQQKERHHFTAQSPESSTNECRRKVKAPQSTERLVPILQTNLEITLPEP